jgi:hypothetical protein
MTQEKERQNGQHPALPRVEAGVEEQSHQKKKLFI